MDTGEGAATTAAPHASGPQAGNTTELKWRMDWLHSTQSKAWMTAEEPIYATTFPIAKATELCLLR